MQTSSMPVWIKIHVHINTGKCEKTLFHMHLCTKILSNTCTHTHTLTHTNMCFSVTGAACNVALAQTVSRMAVKECHGCLRRTPNVFEVHFQIGLSSIQQEKWDKKCCTERQYTIILH